MCGIAGKLWWDGERPADRATVEAMTAALSHRGPDDRGLWSEGPVALGHRRLSIVDLSERGRQPMASPDGRLQLVANGEIYNHLALRRELTARGHVFTSDCDVEVVLALYREHWEAEGPHFVDRLDGMFAFALWDRDARRLVLARDRVGQKPLVYARGPWGVSFASELGALGRDPDLDRRPDDQALADYLAFRCIPHPSCAWRGAAKLPPATVLVAEGGELRATRYWRVAPGPDVSTHLDYEEAVEEVDRLLGEAVERRLMADVPLGALLSGGLDSAAVVAHMARRVGGRLRTYTIGFEEQAWDETPRARRVARLFGTEHHEQLVRPDALAVLDMLVAHHGEPFADSSSIPTSLVSAMAGADLKVVLTGDGGDESFAGYDRHRALLLAARLDRPWGRPVRAAVGLAARLAEQLPAGGHRSVSTRLRRFEAALAATPRRRNHLWRLASSPETLSALLTPDARERLGRPTPYGPQLPGPLPLNEALVLDLERYLPDDVLVKVDVASMAHGLEARAPFLDRQLVEFAAGLPAAFKRDRRGGKRVLRDALRRHLPPDVLDGPKRGFGLPLDRWFRGPLGDHARDVLLSRRCRERGLFEPAAVEALLDGHRDGTLAAHEPLYTLLVLERWFRQEDDAA